MASTVAFASPLAERAECYLDFARSQNTEEQAQEIVKRGLAKLHRPAGFVRKETLGLRVDFEAFRNLRLTGFSNALAFLARNFYRPSEWEVALRVALPSRGHWERTHGVLARHCPAGGVLFGTVVWSGSPEAQAVVVSSSNRMFETLLCPTLSADTSRPLNAVVSRWTVNEDLVAGYPLIARTIVLRI